MRTTTITGQDIGGSVYIYGDWRVEDLAEQGVAATLIAGDEPMAWTIGEQDPYGSGVILETDTIDLDSLTPIQRADLDRLRTEWRAVLSVYADEVADGWD